jgi:hypothetical protein
MYQKSALDKRIHAFLLAVIVSKTGLCTGADLLFEHFFLLPRMTPGRNGGQLSYCYDILFILA